MIKTEAELSKHMAENFANPPYYNSENVIKMFNFIKDNKEFYSAHLKNYENSLMVKSDFTSFIKVHNNSKARYDYTETELVYHMAFFAAGITAICKVWLETGLKETPEELADIIKREYSKNISFIKNA